MRILTEKQLKAWNLTWPAVEPGPWELNQAGVQQALSKQRTAIGVYWIGYSQGTHASFQPNYCGKAVLQPLLARLTQHVKGSHNSYIRDHVLGRTRTRVWFRFVEFGTPQLADVVEGVMITAFREEYVWNRRNEWKQHWALEIG